MSSIQDQHEGVPMGGGEELLDQQEKLLVELFQTYAEAGAPAHRIEERAEEVLRALGRPESRVSSGLNQVIFFFGRRTVLVRVVPGLRLKTVVAVDECCDAVIHDPDRLEEEVWKATHVPPSRRPILRWLVNSSTPAFVMGVFFMGTAGSSSIGMAVSFVIGLILWALRTFFSLLGQRFERSAQRLFPCLAGLCAALLARSVNSFGWLDSSCVQGVELSSIVDFLPGVSIATSVFEVNAGAAISGTSRFFSSIVMSFLLGFGLAYGNVLADVWSAPLEEGVCIPISPLSPWFLFLLVPLLLLSMLNRLDASMYAWPAMLVAGISSWGVTYAFQFVPLHNGAAQGLQTATAAFAAGCVGAISSIVSRQCGSRVISPMAPILAGILVIVPGGMAVQSTTAAFVGGGVGFGLTFFSVAVAITVGLMLAETIFSLPVGKRLSVGDVSRPPMLY